MMWTLMLLFALGVPLTSAADVEYATLSPEEQTLYPVAARIGQMAGQIIELCMSELDETAWPVEERSQIADLVRTIAETPGMKLDCAGCLSIVSLTMSIVRSGLSYEEIKNITMVICYEVVVLEGWDPDVLCSAILDTYAPHVIYVLNVTDFEPRDICVLYNSCEHPLPLTEVQSGLVDRPYTGPRRPGPVNRPSGHKRTQQDYEDAVKLLHVSDVHADKLYSEGAATDCDVPLCCRSFWNGTGSARPWGDFNCNTPYKTIDLLFNYVTGLNISIVAYTGDTPQHTVWNETLQQTIDTDRWFSGMLAQYFPGVPAYYAHGNHDTVPCNLFYPSRPEIQELNRAMFQHWQPLSGFGPEQQVTFESGVYYSVLYRPGLRVLGYNSLWGSLDNFYSPLYINEPDYPAMKHFMENTLAAARENNEKVLLLGHHPTGSGGYLIDYQRFITDINARYGDIIILHLLGHSHGDDFSLVRDWYTGEPTSVQISCPSMTTYTQINPSFRIIYLDPTTFEPFDWDTYHMNINLHGSDPDGVISFAYRASEEYGMIDLSPASFSDFIDRMEADPALMDVYRYNSNTRVYVPGPCDDECARRFICVRRNSDYIRREECYNNVNTTMPV